MIEEMLIGLRLAVRSGYLRTSVFYLLTLAGAVMLAAEFSARQPATVALDVGLSFIRIVLPILIVLLIQELVEDYKG